MLFRNGRPGTHRKLFGFKGFQKSQAQFSCTFNCHDFPMIVKRMTLQSLQGGENYWWHFEGWCNGYEEVDPPCSTIADSCWQSTKPWAAHTSRTSIDMWFMPQENIVHVVRYLVRYHSHFSFRDFLYYNTSPKNLLCIRTKWLPWKSLRMVCLMVLSMISSLVMMMPQTQKLILTGWRGMVKRVHQRALLWLRLVRSREVKNQSKPPRILLWWMPQMATAMSMR